MDEGTLNTIDILFCIYQTFRFIEGGLEYHKGTGVPPCFWKEETVALLHELLVLLCAQICIHFGRNIHDSGHQGHRDE